MAETRHIVAGLHGYRAEFRDAETGEVLRSRYFRIDSRVAPFSGEVARAYAWAKLYLGESQGIELHS